MRLLILGGTVFLGRHLVDAALARGHDVTLFNRGQSGPPPVDGVEHLKGDRTADLSALRGRAWDAAVDTSGYTPAAVRKSAELLAGAVRHYTFVSTISVYEGYPISGLDESAATRSLSASELAEAEAIVPERRATAETFREMYGGLKALCEDVAEAAMPGRVLNVRPGLIAGPWDTTGRFTYWVRRVAKGGDVLAPGRPGRRIRFIDVRDLADWIVRMAEAGRAGVYNATGPAEAPTMRDVLEQCRTVAGSDATFTWVSEGFLLDEAVGAWNELPFWVPEEWNGIFEVRNDRAIAHGLSFRPLSESIRDTLEWERTAEREPDVKVGLAPKREAELLGKWSAHGQAG